MRVVAVGEHGAAAVHDSIQRARHAHLQALHRAAQRHLVGRLHDAVDVVALHGEVHEAEPEPLAPFREGAAQGAEAAVRAQVPDLLADAYRDVQRSLAEPTA